MHKSRFLIFTFLNRVVCFALNFNCNFFKVTSFLESTIGILIFYITCLHKKSQYCIAFCKLCLFNRRQIIAIIKLFQGKQIVS